jgi:hypothetical protein
MRGVWIRGKRGNLADVFTSIGLATSDSRSNVIGEMNRLFAYENPLQFRRRLVGSRLNLCMSVSYSEECSEIERRQTRQKDADRQPAALLRPDKTL